MSFETSMWDEINNAIAEQKNMEKVDDFNTLQKIQQAKIDLSNKNIKMSGHNSFNNYDYFELKDIKKPILEVLQKNELYSRFIFTDTHGKLRIYSESGYCEWQTPLRRVEQKGSSKDTGIFMKAEQAIQTYARRTLWLQAMEIEESNALEADDSSTEESKQAPKPKAKPKSKSKSKPTPKTNKQAPIRQGEPIVNQTTLEIPTVVSEERIKEIIDQSYNYFTANTNGDKEFNWHNAQFTIRKFCSNDAEFEAVKNNVTL